MRTIVYGNGKSRQKWNVNEKLDNVVTWGCNRIFNDVKVDNLVAVDYHVQHLIYESGYAHENKCWFADWNKLPQLDVTTFRVSSHPIHSHSHCLTPFSKPTFSRLGGVGTFMHV